MMTESWIAIGLIALLALWACFKIFEKWLHDQRYLKASEERWRFALRRNINELIVDAIVSDDHYEIDPMVKTAIEESIKQYREYTK